MAVNVFDLKETYTLLVFYRGAGINRYANLYHICFKEGYSKEARTSD